MIRKVSITARARRQIVSASAWWLRHRDKAPQAFEEDLEEMLAAIAGAPFAGTAVRTRQGNVRRVLLARVRYYVYYRVTSAGEVEVLALWHASRGRAPHL